MKRKLLQEDELTSRMDDALRESKALKTTHPQATTIGYPEIKILTGKGFTTGVTSCCVLIIYNDDPNYFFGHHTSPEFLYNGQMYNLWDLLDDNLKQLTGSSAKKAILIGGDTKFFNQIAEFLAKNKIELVASYIDCYDQNMFLDGYSGKTVLFDPKNKTATVSSPALLKGPIELKEGHQSIFDHPEELIAVRAFTLEAYLPTLGKEGFKEFTEKQNGVAPVNAPRARRLSFFTPYEEGQNTAENTPDQKATTTKETIDSNPHKHKRRNSSIL